MTAIVIDLPYLPMVPKDQLLFRFTFFLAFQAGQLLQHACAFRFPDKTVHRIASALPHGGKQLLSLLVFVALEQDNKRTSTNIFHLCCKFLCKLFQRTRLRYAAQTLSKIGDTYKYFPFRHVRCQDMCCFLASSFIDCTM